MNEQKSFKPDNLEFQMYLSRFSNDHPGVLETFWRDPLFLDHVTSLHINPEALSKLQRHEVAATLIAPPRMRAAFMHGPMRAILSRVDYEGYSKYLTDYAQSTISGQQSFTQSRFNSDSLKFAFQTLNRLVDPLVNSYGQPVSDLLNNDPYLNARFRLYTNLQYPEDVLRDSFQTSYTTYQTILERCITHANGSHEFSYLHASSNRVRELAHIRLLKMTDIAQIAKGLTRTSNGFVTPELVTQRQLYKCIELKDDHFGLTHSTVQELNTHLRNHNRSMGDPEENEGYIPELGTSSGCPFGHEGSQQPRYSDNPLEVQYLPAHLRQDIVEPIDIIHQWICLLAEAYNQHI